MLKLRCVAAFATLLALVVAARGTALADSHIEPTSAVETSQQLTLPSGSLFVQVPVELNLSSDRVLEPVSVAPDLWYGVADRFTLGIVHSSGGITGFLGGTALQAEDGLCLNGGADLICDEVYESVGLNLRLGVLSGSLAVAVEAGGIIDEFDPFISAAKVGFVAMARLGPLGVVLNPSVFIGITERDSANEEQLKAPVALVLGLGSRLSLGVQSGIAAPFENFNDFFVVPLSAGVRLVATRNISLDATFTFPQFYTGITDDIETDIRTLTIATALSL